MLKKIVVRIGQALLISGVLFLLCRTAASQSTYVEDMKRLMNPGPTQYEQDIQRFLHPNGKAEESVPQDPSLLMQNTIGMDFFDLEISIDSLESDMRILEDRVEELEEENATLRSLLQEFAQADFDKGKQMAGATLYLIEDLQARVKALESKGVTK